MILRRQLLGLLIATVLARPARAIIHGTASSLPAPLPLVIALESGSAPATPVITVTNTVDLLVLDVIEVFDNAVTLLGSHQVLSGDLADKTFGFNLSPLATGAHSITYRHKRGLQVSAQSNAVSVTV